MLLAYAVFSVVSSSAGVFSSSVCGREEPASDEDSSDVFGVSVGVEPEQPQQRVVTAKIMQQNFSKNALLGIKHLRLQL